MTTALVSVLVEVVHEDGSYVSDLEANSAAHEAVREMQNLTVKINRMPGYPGVEVLIRNPSG